MSAASAGLAKRGLVALASGVLSLLVLVLAFEIFEARRYEQWRADFTGSEGWYGRVTVPSQNPVLMWEYRPNAEFVEPSSRVSVRTNSAGFRDREFAARGETGSRRVAFIGDSVTLGYRTAENEGFVRRFEALAGRAGFDVRAMNFGVDGYNTVQIAELLRTRVLDFDPDEVVYVLCLNDFDLEDSSGQKIRYFRKPGSFTLALLRKALRKLSGLDFHEYHFRRNRERIYREIVGIGELLAERGVAFRVAILPVFFLDMDGFADYPLEHVHAEIVSVLDARGIPSRDLLAAFRAAKVAPRDVARDVWHPLPAGHALIARELQDFLGVRESAATR